MGSSGSQICIIEWNVCFPAVLVIIVPMPNKLPWPKKKG